MKALRCLLAFVLILGLSAFAKADDFQMVVLDPFTGPYTINPLANLQSFSITFAECEEPGQLPAGANFQGCYSFQNETGLFITGLVIAVNGLVPGQTAGCALSGLIDPTTNLPLDIFSNPGCTDLSAGYLLTFTGGSISPGEIVTIAEEGVDVTTTSFPPTTVTPELAPEPASISLLSTGLVAAGSLFARRRRRFTKLGK